MAGLQTKGKHYLAQATNIAKCTEGRFNPAGQLNEQARALTEKAVRVPQPLMRRPAPDITPPAGLLLTADDLAPEHSELRDTPIVAVAGGWTNTVALRLGLSASVIASSRTAIEDGLSRASFHFSAPACSLSEDSWSTSIVDWATSHALKTVLGLEPPVGPWREALKTTATLLSDEGIQLQIVRRSWDEQLWLHASDGYFRFKKRAWPLLRELAA